MQGRGFQRRALRAAAAPVPAAPAPGASTAAEARAVAPASLPDRAAAPPAASWLQQPAPPHSASGGTARAKEARAVAPASSPDRASALPMVWLQQSAQPPSASDALPADSLAAFPTEYALVIGCVVAVTTASFTLVPPQVLLRVWLRIRCLQHHARLAASGARQEAGMQLAGGRGCCARACARAAARLQHAVLVRGPDQSYCLALQVADAPLPGSDDAWAPPAQAGPALRLGSGSAPAEQAAV